MLDTPRRRHMYDATKQRRSVRWIWQGPGHYHIILVQQGNDDWLGYWSSSQLGKIPNKDALAEFLDYATHVVDNARKVGMIGDLPVAIYAFHEAQMNEHRRILGIPDVEADDGAWMRIRHRHPFVPVSYTRMSGFDEFGEMDFSDMRQDIQDMAHQIEEEIRQFEMAMGGGDGMSDSSATDMHAGSDETEDPSDSVEDVSEILPDGEPSEGC